MSRENIDQIFHNVAFGETSGRRTDLTTHTIEEGAIGGFGAYVPQTLAETGTLDRGLKLRTMVLPDIFIDQDSPNAMYARAGLDAKGIVAKVFEALGKDAIAGTVKLA